MINFTTPNLAESIVVNRLREILTTYDGINGIKIYDDIREERVDSSVMVVWLGADFEHRVIREEPRQLPSPATKVSHRMEITINHQDGFHLSEITGLVMSLPADLSGEDSNRVWYWESAEKTGHDLTEHETPRGVILTLGFEEMI